MPTIATATPSKMPQTSKNGELPTRPSNHHPRIAPPLILIATNHPMIERRARTGATELRPLTSRSEPIRSPDSAREDRSSFSRSPFRIWTFVPSSTLNYKQHYTKLITLIQKLLQKPTPKHSLNITATPHHLCSTRTSTISRHTGFKAVSTGRGNNKPNQLTESPSPLMGEDQSLSQCLTLGAEGETRQHQPHTQDRHCGLDPQSRGEVTGMTTRQHNQQNPLSLDRRGIKGEGEKTKQPGPSFPRRRETTGWGGHATLSNYWIRPWRKLVLASRQYPQRGNARARTPRHCGLDPQSRGEAAGPTTRPTQTNLHPPLP